MIVVRAPVFSEKEAASVYAFLIHGDMLNLLGQSWEKLFELFFTSMPYGTAKARDGDPAEWIRDQFAGWTDSQIHQWVKIHQLP